jgi:hypothetical protein
MLVHSNNNKICDIMDAVAKASAATARAAVGGALAADRNALLMARAAINEAGEEQRRQEALIKMRRDIDQRVPGLSKRLFDVRSVKMGTATNQLMRAAISRKAFVELKANSEPPSAKTVVRTMTLCRFVEEAQLP